jgi:hypothetical protein
VALDWTRARPEDCGACLQRSLRDGEMFVDSMPVSEPHLDWELGRSCCAPGVAQEETIGKTPCCHLEANQLEASLRGKDLMPLSVVPSSHHDLECFVFAFSTNLRRLMLTVVEVTRVPHTHCPVLFWPGRMFPA